MVKDRNDNVATPAGDKVKKQQQQEKKKGNEDNDDDDVGATAGQNHRLQNHPLFQKVGEPIKNLFNHRYRYIGWPD